MAVFTGISDTREGFDVGFTYQEWQADVDSAVAALSSVTSYMLMNDPVSEYFDVVAGEGLIEWAQAGFRMEGSASEMREMEIWGAGLHGFGFRGGDSFVGYEHDGIYVGNGYPDDVGAWPSGLYMPADTEEAWIEGEQHALSFRGKIKYFSPDLPVVIGQTKEILLTASSDPGWVDGSYLKLGGSVTLINELWSGTVSNIEWGGWAVGAGDEPVFSAQGAVAVKLDATALQDVLDNGGGFSSLMGVALGGNDSLTGTAAADYLDAGNGNDKLFGLAGDDALLGGFGNDKLDGGEGDDFFDGGDGNDAVVDLAGNNVIVDLYGNVKVATGGGNDSVEFGDGNAKVVAGGGNNVITGGDGNNSVTCEGGADEIELGNGNNKVVAGDGNNSVSVGNGSNNIATGAGNDVIATGDGKNKVVSGAGDDVVTTGSGGDNIKADLGADWVDAGAGKNLIDLGADTNNDTVVFAADFFDGLAAQAVAFNQLKNFNLGDDLAFANAWGLAADDVLVSATASAADPSGYALVFNTATGKLYYDADGTGSGVAAVQVGLVKGAALGGDFDVGVEGGFLTIGSVSAF